jgi:WhiB family transcriptional regulator, redox-sensing transcriptional regulator
MQWPGTGAVLEKAELEETWPAQVLPQAGPAVQVPEDVISPAPAGDDAFFMPDVRTDLELPCRDDPELFFAESPADVEFAKSLCLGCAARLTCLAGAIERREPWGVWGGEVFLRGEIVPFKRPRGRPRKNTVAA